MSPLYSHPAIAAVLKNAVPLAALFDESWTKPNPAATAEVAGLNAADVIFGVDVMTRKPFVAYGMDVLKRIVATGATVTLKMMAVAIDQETDELERLLALMVTIKGKHDYPD